MGIIEKIKEIYAEMARTQNNKATEYHLGHLKAKITKLRAQLLEPPKVLIEMGRPFSKEVQLVSFHAVSKGFFGECGQRGGYFEMFNIPLEIVDEIYKVALVSLSPNVPAQIFMGLMVNLLKLGDILFP